MTTMKLTHHARYDRTERLVAILSHIGLGETKYRLTKLDTPNRTAIITTTGVMLVYDREETTLITGYVPTVDKVYAMCVRNDIRIDQSLIKVIKRNWTRYEWIAKM